MKVSRKKIEANRRNARKSTGPKSAAGKKRVSGNAAKHMLNAPPSHELVLKWFRIIMDDPHAEPDPKDFGARQRAAMLYAVARAQVERTRENEAAVTKKLMQISEWVENGKSTLGYGNTAPPDRAGVAGRCRESIGDDKEEGSRTGRPLQTPGGIAGA
ncbi:MAG: hypothetical protein MnENMB40S_15670 [Rhizobiaceae bacterium MnEN-MB40S]|nr:MAG: hypothetical protein MnENMB40S_15670 [Rhizobiaceae bacterium MnEN-MB40S]